MNDLQNLDHTMGFWINIIEPGTTLFLPKGDLPNSTQNISLYKGWNMLGYPSLTNRNRTAALNNLVFDTHVDSVWTFDAATQTWDEIDENDYFHLGKGYWVHATQDCTWEVPL
jgi:hypothetical protein